MKPNTEPTAITVTAIETSISLRTLAITAAAAASGAGSALRGFRLGGRERNDLRLDLAVRRRVLLGRMSGEQRGHLGFDRLGRRLGMADRRCAAADRSPRAGSSYRGRPAWRRRTARPRARRAPCRRRRAPARGSAPAAARPAARVAAQSLRRPPRAPAGCGGCCPGRAGSNGRVSSSSDWASSSDSRVAGSTGLPAPGGRSKEEPYLSLAEFMTDRHSVFQMTAPLKGERLDRMLAASIGPLALAPEGPDPGRRGDGRSAHDPRSRPSRQRRGRDRRHDPAGRARGATGRGYPAQHRARGRQPDRDRQAEGPGGASGRRKPVRHAGERADRPLRREPFGHRRGEAARHRAPARQGHHRADGGGEDRPGAPRALGAIRRPRPDRRRSSAAISPSSGARRTARRARSMRRSTATRMRATRRRSGRAAARPITHWELLEQYPGTDGKPVASLLACRLETGRTHQIRVHLAHIGHPLLGRRHLRPRLQDQGRPLARRRPRRARGPWQTGPACLSIGLRTPRDRRHRCGSSPDCRTTLRVCGIPSQGCASRPQGRVKS